MKEWQRKPAGDVHERVEVPPDDRSGVQGLVVDTHTVVESPENDVAKVLAAGVAEDLNDRVAAHRLALVNKGDTQVQAPHGQGGGEDEHHARAPADEGGGTDPVQHARDDAVTLTVQEEEADTVPAECGDVRVQAPNDEGGGNCRVLDAHHDVGPADGREHHDSSRVEGGDSAEGLHTGDQDHGLLHGRTEQQDKEGGEAAPTPDDIEAGDMRGMMTETVCLALDDQGDAQHGDATQVPDEGGGDGRVLHGEEVHTVHTDRGDAHVQDPHDAGGSKVRSSDACHDVVPAVSYTHLRAHET